MIYLMKFCICFTLPNYNYYHATVAKLCVNKLYLALSLSNVVSHSIRMHDILEEIFARHNEAELSEVKWLLETHKIWYYSALLSLTLCKEVCIKRDAYHN